MDAAQNSFPTVLDGARFLLGETCEILNELKARYMIVGGWTPFLRNKSKLIHPGTKDVDVLFEDGYISGNLGNIIATFLNRGFLPSAKHDFQLLKEIKVGGRTLVYNVDLLHPSESQENPHLFVDHLNLQLPESAFELQSRFVRSIVLGDCEILFDGLSEPFSFDYQDASGSGRRVTIPLMDFVGLLASKTKSIANLKRQRDAFDVYLTFLQPELNLTEKINSLSDATIP